MVSCAEFYKAAQNAGIGFFAGVPDSLLKDICAYITDHAPPNAHIIAANEGGAVGLALGHYLASGQPALVYMQNSGQGNAINPLASLANSDVYGIPMILLVGWRGEPGTKDEPQHLKQGKITRDLFRVLGVEHEILPTETTAAKATLKQMVEKSMRTQQPVALLVRKGTFESYALRGKPQNNYSLSREEAIHTVVDFLDHRTFVVSTTGKISRELFEIREIRNQGHEKDFLTVGGMGHASQIALGAALTNPERQVCCLDGDGALLMHTGGLGILAQQKIPNFKHILLNNGAHESVGGQPTAGFAVDFQALAQAVGYPRVWKAESEAELRKILPSFLETSEPCFLEIRVALGSRSNLGRPTRTPAENKNAVMEFFHA